MAATFANTEEWVNVVGTVRSVDLLGHHPKQRFVMLIQDKTGVMQLVFFRNPGSSKMRTLSGTPLR